MKLSEAINIGSLLHPQAHTFRSGQGTCALEAAADAVGVTGIYRWQDVCKKWPWVLTTRMDCPCGQCQRKYYMVRDLIYVLNDSHRWPRPRIAAWVATLEAIYDPTPIAVEVEHEPTRV